MTHIKCTVLGKMIRLVLLGFLAWFAKSGAFGASATLIVTNGSSDGQITTTTIAGSNVWQNINGDPYMYFQVPSSFPFNSNNPVYVKFTYYDAGVGLIKCQYDSTTNAYTSSEAHARSSRVGTGAFVTNYQQLMRPWFKKRENSHGDLRLNLVYTNSVSPFLSVVVNSAIIQDTPFTEDARFTMALTKPWLAAYSGETRWDDVDASFLTDKVMCGYQGWFGGPNDLSDKGWVHWVRSGGGVLDTNHFNTDMWPDMSQYPSTSWIQAASIKTKSGQTAYVFSDSDPAVVETQFQWMRKYNIDGVFLQRFLNAVDPNEQWALANVRAAAHAEGRVWVIEYDVSNLDDSTAFHQLTNDWAWMVNTFKATLDSRYGFQNNKPVVAIYGMGDTNKDMNYSTNNGITVPTGQKIISWFKSNPYASCYVWGGVPINWQSQWSKESGVYTNYNAIEAWHSSSYASDIQKCASFGATYWPILWPGFSWSNEQNETNKNGAFKDRFSGMRYWTNVFNVMATPGVSNLFVGMFDEYDEGTAIMPMSDDPPSSPSGKNGGQFIDNQGKPSDWWLLLTAQAKADMFKQRTNNIAMPLGTELEMTNRSNIGPEVDVTLAATNLDNGLSLVPVTLDGNTAVETVDGKTCRYNANSQTTNHYFYFDVDDNFSQQTTNGPDEDITIEVQYYDGPGGVSFQLQYDSVTNAYTAHPKVTITQGTLRWRTVRYEIPNAYFGNRENVHSDFRIFVQQNAKLDLGRVWVRKDELKYQIWTVDDIGSVGAPSSGDIDEIFDTYTVDGSGTDIFGTNDSCALVDQTLTGDGRIIARVNSFTCSTTNINASAKAGVMIRATTNANSASVAVVVTPSNGIKFLVRPTTGASTTQITATNLAAPYWVKIVRTANNFYSYTAPDPGTNWTCWVTNSVSMPSSVVMGLAVTSKDYGILDTATFQDVSVNGDPEYDDGL